MTFCCSNQLEHAYTRSLLLRFVSTKSGQQNGQRLPDHVSHEHLTYPDVLQLAACPGHDHAAFPYYPLSYLGLKDAW